MDPVTSHDYVKFVYQIPDVRDVYYAAVPKKPFKVEETKKSDKSKKDLKKQNPQEKK
jgi:hypothetical protein